MFSRYYDYYKTVTFYFDRPPASIKDVLQEFSQSWLDSFNEWYIHLPFHRERSDTLLHLYARTTVLAGPHLLDQKLLAMRLSEQCKSLGMGVQLSLPFTSEAIPLISDFILEVAPTAVVLEIVNTDVVIELLQFLERLRANRPSVTLICDVQSLLNTEVLAHPLINSGDVSILPRNVSKLLNPATADGSCFGTAHLSINGDGKIYVCPRLVGLSAASIYSIQESWSEIYKIKREDNLSTEHLIQFAPVLFSRKSPSRLGVCQQHQLDLLSK